MLQRGAGGVRREQAFAVAGAAGPPADWQSRVAKVVRRSFDVVSLKLDFRRFEATTDQILVTPYEFLCGLAAQQLITDEEQSEIQSVLMRTPISRCMG